VLRNLIISLLLIVGVLPAWARVPIVMVVPGGTLESLTTSYKVMDIKGQALIGKTSGGGITVEVGGTAFWRGEEAPPGTVRLSIERVADTVNSDVKVRWGSSRVPDVYASSVYPGSVTDWNQIVFGATTPPSVISADFSPTNPSEYVNHRRQVGAGLEQAYYKALIAGNDKATYLPSAEGVGKFNLSVPGPHGSELLKYSLIAVPFLQYDYDLDKAIGQQLTANASKGNATEIWSYGVTNFSSQKYLSPAGWVTVEGTSGFIASLGEGYVIQTKLGHADKTITIVGEVKRDGFGPRTVGANLYTFFGNPYPIYKPLANIGMSAIDGALQGSDSGLADQIWGWTGSDFGNQVYLRTGASWTTFTGSGISSLEAGKAYVLRRNPSAPLGGFNWRFNPY